MVNEAYNRFLRQTGVSRSVNRSDIERLREDIDATRRSLERRYATVKHASDLDRRRAEDNIARLECNERALMQRLDDAKPLRPSRTCRRCGSPITDRQAYTRSGRCTPCSTTTPTTRTPKETTQ